MISFQILKVNLYAVKHGSEQNSLLLPGIGRINFKVCLASWRAGINLFRDIARNLKIIF